MSVSEREGPETEVGGGVGNGPEDEFDGLDELVHHEFAEGVFFVAVDVFVLFNFFRREGVCV